MIGNIVILVWIMGGLISYGLGKNLNFKKSFGYEGIVAEIFMLILPSFTLGPIAIPFFISEYKKRKIRLKLKFKNV